MTHFVLVHGIRPKPKPVELLESSRFFLGQSSGTPLDPGHLHLAYWADEAGYTDPVNDDRGAFRRYSFREHVTLGGLGLASRLVMDAVERHHAAFLNRAGAPDAKEVVQLLAEALVLLRDPLATEVMRAFVRDVHMYFNGGIREKVKNRVRAALDRVPPGARVALVGHSLGSVVAVDVLLSDRRRVDWLLTLGSPLGFNAVRAKLAFRPDEFDSLRELAPRWDNLYDPIDVVSLDADLADDLPNAAPNDMRLRNEFVNSVGKRNPHSLYGFLGHPETGALVAAFREAEG
jgi:hypothetical protein